MPIRRPWALRKSCSTVQPSWPDEGVEGSADRLVVDGQAELLVAGCDRFGDVVAEEEEDDRGEGEDRDDALRGVDQVGEDGRDDDRVDGEE